MGDIMTDNTKVRNRKTNRNRKVKVHQNKARHLRRHKHNQRNKQERRQRLTAGGLFVRLIKDMGFVRQPNTPIRGTVFEKLDDSQSQLHTITMDYILGKAALLVVYDIKDDGNRWVGVPIINKVLYYDEQPVPEATRKAMESKKRKAVPGWKQELRIIKKEIK